MASPRIILAFVILIFGNVQCNESEKLQQFLDENFPSSSGIDLTGISEVFGNDKQNPRGLGIFNADLQAQLNQLNVKVSPLRNRNAQLKRFSEAIKNATQLCKTKVPVNALTKLGSNYYFMEERANFLKNFQNAAMECRNMGMFLTTLETDAENTLIRSYISTFYNTAPNIPAGAAPTLGYYIGLNDLATPATYVWVADGSNLAYPPTTALNDAGASVVNIRTKATAASALLTDIVWDDTSTGAVAGKFICELPKTCQTVLNLPS